MLIAPLAEFLDDEGDLAIPSAAVELICPHFGSKSSYRSDEIRVEVGQQKH